MRILVTGASGFIGSLLVPALCADGHEVRAFGRDPERIRAMLSHTAAQRRPASHHRPMRVEAIRGDAVTGEGLERALADVEVAYYLIHSMERARTSERAGRSAFSERENRAAENFAAAAARADVQRIVYLGGLVPRTHPATGEGSRRHSASARVEGPLSRHLASRLHVERVLLEAVEDSLALRASIVIGARSRSFRLLVHLLERMPVLTLPSWRTLRTQPIDERDIIDMLAACAHARLARRSLDVGGPEALTYGEMLEKIAELMLVNRPTVALNVKLTGLTGRIAAAIAGEDPELVVALMESLDYDLLPVQHNAAELLGVRLHSFEASVEHSLAEWERGQPLAAR